MTIKRIFTIGITAVIAASTVAVTALTSVSGYSKSYTPGYSYSVTNNSYVKMDYHESGNFVQTVATNKKSTTTYTRVGIYAYTNDGYFVAGSNPIKNLAKKGASGYVGANGWYNYRSSGATNYQHIVIIYTDNTRNKVASSISRTVG